MKTLIAVEDHATRSLLERAITSRLHRVRHAIDFDTALKMCADERPALVLLDWRLSTSRKPTLLERIRALRDGDQLLVFAVLPAGGAHEAQAALEAGANDYIPMPVDPRLAEWRIALAERQSGELTRRRRAEESVRQLDKAVTTMQLGVTITDLEGTILFVNEAAATMHGYEVEDLIWANARVFSPDPSAPAEAPAPGAPSRWSRERMSRRKDGSLFPVHLMSDVVRDASGTPTAIVTSCEDITERRRAEEALRESEARFALAVAGANDGVWDWDLRAGALYVSPRWLRILGVDETAPPPAPDGWLERIHPEDRTRFSMRLTAHLDGKTPQLECEYRMRHEGGGWRWVLTRGVAVRGADGKATRIAGSQTDVTDRRGFDALTLLPNRALFLDRLELALSRASRSPDARFAVLFVDLDHFKEVNDSLGHLAGDELLLAAARRLEQSVRPGDTVARLGGDEFAVLLERIADPADAPRVSERILAALSRPLVLGGTEVTPSASIGIALGRGSDKAVDVLTGADAALYRAKRAGRARAAVFDDAMREEARGRVAFESELRGAPARGELRLLWKPLVSPRSRRLVALRPLLLWNHPSRGLLPSGDFLLAAEESGAVLALDDWMLATACRVFRGFQAGSPAAAALTLAVPVSARFVARDDLAARVERALAAAGLPAPSLTLDVPDEAIAEDRSAPLRAIRGRGVSIALGRFGGGTAPLAAVAGAPLDALRLDGALVGRLPGDASALALCRAAAAVANALGLALLASGVETEAQNRLLAELGCLAADGALFGPQFDEAEAKTVLESALD
jgi:diguanylate cyclase (GGDEF)-like protein/PAS domain S-box-containing protein